MEHPVWRSYTKEYITTHSTGTMLKKGPGGDTGLDDLTATGLSGGGDTEYEWTWPRRSGCQTHIRGATGRDSRSNMEQFRYGKAGYGLLAGQECQQSTRRYLDEMPGTFRCKTIWTDVPPFYWSSSKERISATPHRSRKRCWSGSSRASSNPGDVVLDPFCGCGTAVVAAHRLGRRWAGIDITWLAVALMRSRLTTTFPGDFPDGVPVDGEPADEAAALALAERDKYQFQFWAVGKLGGTSRGGENRKGRDRGIDGVIAFPEMDPGRPSRTPDYQQVIISVKGGATGPAHVRELAGTVQREGAALGVLVVTQPPTPEMEREAASAGVYRSTWDGSVYPKLQILTAAEVVRGATVDMPSLRGVPQYTPAARARRRTPQGRLGV